MLETFAMSWRKTCGCVLVSFFPQSYSIVILSLSKENLAIWKERLRRRLIARLPKPYVTSGLPNDGPKFTVSSVGDNGKIYLQRRSIPGFQPSLYTHASTVTPTASSSSSPGVLQSLSNSIPQWIEKLDGIKTQITQHHTESSELDEFLAQSEKHDPSSSIQSIIGTENVAVDSVYYDFSYLRAEKGKPEEGKLSQAAADETGILRSVSPIEPSKKKVDSAVSGVYYDSTVQNGFEELVNFFSSSRNALRKEKMARRMTEMK